MQNTDFTQIELVNPMSYAQFRQLVEEAVLQERTTGPEQTHERIEFTRLNLHRMKRVEKQFTFFPALKDALGAHRPNWKWQVLVEAWCGDGAQLLPALAALADQVPSLHLTVLLRDENPNLMDTCLTNGSRAIPKLLCLDADTNQRLFTWGPRPAAIQAKLVEYRAQFPQATHTEFMTQVHTCYAKDRSLSLQQDLLALVQNTLVSQELA